MASEIVGESSRKLTNTYIFCWKSSNERYSEHVAKIFNLSRIKSIPNVIANASWNPFERLVRYNFND